MQGVGEGSERSEADAALIVQARHDRAAFGEIYRFYVRRVYAFCRAHSGSREEAEDLTAQTFERALAAIGRYEDRGGRFSSWLLRIAANAAVDRARRGRHDEPLGDDSLSEKGALRSGHGGTTRWVEEWEQSIWIKAHVATLPKDQRRVVGLRFYEDRGFGDVATEMGRSEGAVKQLAQRALKALRARMDEEAVDDVRFGSRCCLVAPRVVAPGRTAHQALQFPYQPFTISPAESES